jgi:hypothetical protein
MLGRDDPFRDGETPYGTPQSFADIHPAPLVERDAELELVDGRWSPSPRGTGSRARTFEI